jgi:very-short-patch-repair endonuclease
LNITTWYVIMADNENHVVRTIRELLKDPIEDGYFLENHEYNQILVDTDQQRTHIKISYICKKKKKIVEVDGTYQIGDCEKLSFTFRFKLERHTSCF